MNCPWHLEALVRTFITRTWTLFGAGSRARRRPGPILLALACGAALAGWVMSGPARPPAQSGPPPALTARAAAAARHLDDEMDAATSGTVVVDDYQSGYSGFYPSNWFGDHGDLQVDERCTDGPHTGPTCFRFTYTSRGPNGYAGIIWVYPDGNQGAARGRDLTGARTITGWIRSRSGPQPVTLELSRVVLPNGRVHQQSVEFLADEYWSWFALELDRVPLLNVTGGFAIALSRARNGAGPVVIDLDDVRFDDAHPDVLRLIRSYVPTECPADDSIRNVAFLYDNCVALLAYLSRHDGQGDRRARLLADTIVAAQLHDRYYKDGRFRNGYAVGPLIDTATGFARLPGLYDPACKTMNEDRYVVSSDAGNTAWAGLVLLASHQRLEAGKADDYAYLRAALRAARWIETECRFEGKFGGYTGGFEGWEPTPSKPKGPTKLHWRSTEHNLDIYVFYGQLASALAAAKGSAPDVWGDADPQPWHARAKHALGFVLAMYEPRERCFRIGVRDDVGTINLDMTASDAQTWSLLALGHLRQFRERIGWTGPPSVPPTLAWVECHCRATDAGRSGYLFSDRGKGIWPEGSGHLAAAYQYLGDRSRARAILEEVAPLAARGTLPAAYPAGAETGMYKQFVEDAEPVMWTYPVRPHLGATAWFLLQGANPYWLDGPPAD
jgi:hypothetical protein